MKIIMLHPVKLKMFDNCLTNSVKLKQPRKLLTGCSMKEQTINIREFLRNYKKFSAANTVIIIANHGKPESVFMPYEQWEQKIENKNRSRCFTMEDLEKYTKGLPQLPADTSQKIDEIVYTYPNKITKSKRK